MISAAYAEHRAVHSHHHQYGRHVTTPPGGLERLAFWATWHYLAGCAIAEVLGLVIGTVLGWVNLETFALTVGLAIVFGSAFTIVPLLRGGMAWRSAAWVARAADTASHAIMESGVELQAVSTTTLPASDAAASTNAFSTRLAEVSETHPALVELHPKVLAARRQEELVTARAPELFRKRTAERIAESVIVSANGILQRNARTQEKPLTFQAWEAG